MIAEYPFSDAEQGRGGVMQSTFHLIEGFVMLDNPSFDLHVVSQTFGCERYETRQLANVTIHFVPKLNSELAKFLLNPLRLLLCFMNVCWVVRPHLVHGQGSVIAILLSQLFTRKNLQTIHGIYRNEDSKLLQNGLTIGRRIRIALNTVVEKNYLCRVRNLVSLTAEIERIVLESTGGKARIFPSYVAIDPAFFNKRPEKPIGCRIKVLFVAAITPRKGLHLLLEAFAQLADEFSDVDMRIVGMWDWASDYIAQLQMQYAPLMTAGRLVFTGSVNRSTLFAEFAASDLLVLPSLAESAPAVVSQAMCLGIPVIATRVGGVPQMIQDGVSGILVEPGDAAALGEAMRSMLAEPELRHRLSSVAREVAQQRYHPRAVAQETVAIYRAIATFHD